MRYFVANWKANKNTEDAVTWIKTFQAEVEKDSQLINNLHSNQLKIILCPPSPLLVVIKNLLANDSLIELGAQDISAFDSGSFTGEVTGYCLKDYIKYAIIGHSERRKLFRETDEILFKKAALAKNNGIEPIYCVSNENDPFPKNLKILAYEPESAIGTGNNEALEKILMVKRKIPLAEKTVFLYGGSVNNANVFDYLHAPGIDGFIVSKTALNPSEFVSLISRT